jgi:diguanylate cyclase (GGDEF)-like protein
MLSGPKAPFTRHGPPLSQVLTGTAPRLILLALLTIVAMLSHDLLPKRVLRIVPSADFSPGFYAHDDQWGRPAGRMISQSPPEWECDVAEGAESAPPCGFVVSFWQEGKNGRDLSAYDSIRIDMTAEGDDRQLRFSLREFEPGLSQPGQWDSEKIENVVVPAGDIGPGLQIGLREFKVVDWWLISHPLPRRRVAPSFEHVTGFGIDIAPNAPPGRHLYRLSKVEFVGELISAEQWYRGILWFWVVLTIATGLAHILALLRRQREERQRLQQLLSRNAALESETVQLRERSLRDPLTGLYNRYGVTEWVLDLEARPRTEEISLIVLDVDFFKRINDSVGHEGGDRILRRVSALLAHNTRISDCVARWGGEEFVVLLPETALRAAQHIAEKLRAAVEAAPFPELGGPPVTISLGVGQAQDREPLERLFDRVDQALYRAKEAGRNRVETAKVD